MKCIDLNIENLHALGLTEDIFKNNFEEWLLKNQDFYVDLNNNKIYVGKVRLKKDLQHLFEIIKNNHLDNGGKLEDLEKDLLEIKVNLNKKIDKTLDNIPEELKYEFLTNSLIKLENKITEKKEQYFTEKLNSILQIEENQDDITQQNELNKLNDNPYPRIFTTTKAFNKFKNLVVEFGNTKENLANYSFVFHRMKKDNLIFDDYQQTQFVYFLLEFDINISRIKPKTQLGNNDLRESIYNRI